MHCPCHVSRSTPAADDSNLKRSPASLKAVRSPTPLMIRAPSRKHLVHAVRGGVLPQCVDRYDCSIVEQGAADIKFAQTCTWIYTRVWATCRVELEAFEQAVSIRRRDSDSVCSPARHLQMGQRPRGAAAEYRLHGRARWLGVRCVSNGLLLERIRRVDRPMYDG